MAQYILASNSLSVPGDFPGSAHDKVGQLVHAGFDRLHVNSRIRTEFYMGWAAIAHRFLATTQYGEDFARSLEQYGAAPAIPHRHEQERAFFGFIVSGLACLEATAYAVYSLGAAADATGFPFSTARHRRAVTIEKTRDRLQTSYPDLSITAVMTGLCDAVWYGEWVQIRNVLVHRGLPGRLISIGNINALGSEYQPFEDVSGVALSSATIGQRRARLAEALSTLVGGTKAFAQHVT